MIDWKIRLLSLSASAREMIGDASGRVCESDVNKKNLAVIKYVVYLVLQGQDRKSNVLTQTGFTITNSNPIVKKI
jgi:hypothetical protein